MKKEKRYTIDEIKQVFDSVMEGERDLLVANITGELILNGMDRLRLRVLIGLLEKELGQ